jgi:hypothetical protein
MPRADWLRLAASAVLALLTGTAFVYGGYWIPPVELRVALSPLALGGLVIAVRTSLRRFGTPSPAAKLHVGGTAAAAWLLLFAAPFGLRYFALRAEADGLPRWHRERPIVRLSTIASNNVDYEAVQIARASRDKVEPFYLAGMKARRWRFEKRLDEFERSDGPVYLIFVKGRHKIAYHLGPCWNGTMVEIYRVTFMPGAEEPGTGRRVWYQWVRRVRERIGR